MDDQNKNLILATALSFLVILAWFIIFPPEQQVTPEAPAAEQAADGTPTTADGTTAPGAADGSAPATGNGAAPEAVADAPRLTIDTPNLDGSINLIGGRIDDVSLKRYTVSVDNDETVRLLSPVGETNPYYALYGWAPGAGLTPADVPGDDTEWSVEEGEALTPATPVTLRWDSPAGLIFRRVMSVDEEFLITIEQSVENPTETAVRAQPYALINRHGLPELTNFFVIHEGVIGQHEGELVIEDYDNVTDFAGKPETFTDVTNGWIGFTDHYWMTNLIPDPGEPATLSVSYLARGDIYQTLTKQPTQDIAAGATVTNRSHLFAGAKEWEVIKHYQDDLGFVDFVNTVDWGWFWMLTKPIFRGLHFLNGLIGNMGLAIIALTFIIKAILFPLAYKSYVSMAKMKELQPEMEKLKEKAGDDRQKLQREMMALYKKEKVNPASGCLPILLQIPIFFSLYKVIFVTLELRQAAFFGPFRDLSQPDPTSLFNLYGLLPWANPEPGTILALIFIGILPLLLGISMWLQQKLNPAPTDPTQQMIFAWMPWVFMFMLGGFASGLVVYWIANNTITFIQQYTIMRSHGHKPDVFGNIKKSFKKKPKGDAAKAANSTAKPGGKK
ncbi:membrane protein insertase YidC [Vannielia litorea]|uniref:membrane protein insertase YidC n=1 Tax=Vannielia litorea TaxID=1217970 RepID=UPI001C98B2B2|nr:membrane protein insertase YidC [Vannielia litorea]MBY6049684.1 membrane protein insertase YidC [Vannielia litorea]MBY6077098.1 membrane protein insertase YidC [Vannielia litorea]